MNKLESRLEAFASQHKIRGKGPLSLVLVLSRKAREQKPPFSANDFLTPQGGQVAGLGRGAVQAILADHGIDRVLAEEGGRTSRGSIQNMRAYVDILNELAKEKLLDFPAIEEWWIDRVREFFRSKPFSLKADSSKSIRSIVSDLIDAAFARQRECPGAMVVGAVMQHLVGAKISTALPEATIKHEGFSVAERIDILEIEQFVATNIYEWSVFQQAKRTMTVRQLVDVYNHIIDQCETDPSLKIAMG